MAPHLDEEKQKKCHPTFLSGRRSLAHCCGAGHAGRAPALLKAGPLTNPCLTNHFFIKELEPRCCSRLTPDRRDHWG